MKHLGTILILTFLIVSCSSSKKVLEDASLPQSNPISEPTVSEEKVLTDSSQQTTVMQNQKELESFTDGYITDDSISVSIEIVKPIQLFDHSTFNILLSKHVSINGNVDYEAIKSDWKALKDYITQLSNNLPNNTWTKEEKLVYWVNTYNALTIDLILRHYPLKSIKDIKDPWKQRYWKLGNKWYNLDEIEHQILRKMDEPRIHFAIVCASFSCPKLLNEAYIASKLETQLTEATKGFLSDGDRNIISEKRIQLSKIFKWFAKDFKQDGSLIDFLNQYSEVEISASAKKSYLDYNWYLNE